MRRIPIAAARDLDRIAESDAALPVDVALGRLLAGLDVEHGPVDPGRARVIALSGALVSAARRDGHSAVELAAWAGRPFPGDARDRLPELPLLDDWRRALDASPIVGGPDSACPLVLDGRDRLAFRRFVDAERRTATAVAHRAAASEADVPSAAARDAFARLFPPRGDGALDRQALAAAAALHQRVLFVAGGPGTGKTYTAARLLALLLADRPGLRVALAAPTGKAAGRLRDSLLAGLAGLPTDLAAPVPTDAVTLHRLLGASLDRPGFRHDAREPLPHDVVLVDEGSMISLPLFDALLDALRPEARLVVLGDPDQLAPVEAGTPFADVCAVGEGTPPPALAAFCAALGLAGAPSGTGPPPLAGTVVTLTESRRFGAASDVGALATAIRQSEAEAALAVLEDPARGDATLVEDGASAEAVRWALPFARAVVEAATPDEALAALDRFRVLAAVRRGARGVEGLNAAVERALADAGLARWSPYAEPFYRGRPILVTLNSREVGLANGDIGVAWTDGADRVVVFPDGEGTRSVPYARLPPHEPAWALTVHKSQGSEFDAVGAVLPEPDTRGASLLTRELLYTATTRAKGAVTVFGERDAVAAAVGRRQRRASGLVERLEAAARAVC